jgi:DNA polymerase/3'-5' exonuclease PolX
MAELKFMLAKEFIKGKHDVDNWFISEKFDGYRACYSPKDNHFYSRQNKPFNAPEWYLKAMPPKLVDGELWVGRNRFQEMGTVRKKTPIDEEWLNITFQVYDMPDHPGTFEERLKELDKIVRLTRIRWKKICKTLPYPMNTIPCPLVLAKQIRVQDLEHLDRVYKDILKEEGEGIMLKDPVSPYEGKRSNYLLKYKPSFDEEAIVVDHKMGEGKYKGLLGALICKPLINHETYSSINETQDHEFSISGMDDSIRNSYKTTHPIGTIISYEHSGKTDKGKPRFGRYTRIRTDITIKDHEEEPIEFTRSRIIEIFNILGNHEKNNGESFKAVSYFKAIKNIQGLNELTEESLKGVKGIGKSLCEKIMCIVNTGTCNAYDKIKDVIDHRKDFLDISGIGPKKATELVELGHTSIESLRKAPNLTDILNDKQLIGLKYYEDILERIPQGEIDIHNKLLTDILKEIDPTAELTIAGSYRRRAEDSGDIDVLLKGDSKLYKKFIDVLEKKGYLYETLAKGPKKYNGMCKLPDCLTFRRIDIMITKEAEYPFAILYFTGSKDFNTLMRQHALDRGLSMNEYSLKDVDTKVPVDHKFGTEKDIFDYLEYPYVEPWLR